MGGRQSVPYTSDVACFEGRYHEYTAVLGLPIGEGSCRVACECMVESSKPPGGPKVGRKYVVKFFKDQFAWFAEKWRPDLTSYRRAAKIVQAFNEAVRPVSTPHRRYRRFEVVTPQMARVREREFYVSINGFLFGSRIDHRDLHVLMEPLLLGEFRKFNNNLGYCDNGFPEAQTLTHWSAHKSRYQYMLCDLQGVVDGEKYVITDPCIHSQDGKHGATDLGVFGMEKVLAGHKCNELCKKLGLPENPVPYEPSSDLHSLLSCGITNEERLRPRENSSTPRNTLLRRHSTAEQRNASLL